MNGKNLFLTAHPFFPGLLITQVMLISKRLSETLAE